MQKATIEKKTMISKISTEIKIREIKKENDRESLDEIGRIYLKIFKKKMFNDGNEKKLTKIFLASYISL